MIHIKQIELVGEGNQRIVLEERELRKVKIFINGLIGKRQKKSKV